MIKNKIINILASHIGVEEEDITLDDSFTNDLHMNPIEVADFLSALREKEIDTSKINISEIDTVQKFIEELEIEN